jgi:hypothetical protein
VLHLAVRRTALWSAVIAGCAGLVLGGLAAWLLRRRRA